MSEEPILRVSCRVVLLDDANRVLLLEHVVDDPAASYASIWLPPGGGLEEGESPVDAALRELWEETGLRLGEVGPLVWIRRVTFPLAGGEIYWEYRAVLRWPDELLSGGRTLEPRCSRTTKHIKGQMVVTG